MVRSLGPRLLWLGGLDGCARGWSGRVLGSRLSLFDFRWRAFVGLRMGAVELDIGARVFGGGTLGR